MPGRSARCGALPVLGPSPCLPWLRFSSAGEKQMVGDKVSITITPCPSHPQPPSIPWVLPAHSRVLKAPG